MQWQQEARNSHFETAAVSILFNDCHFCQYWRSCPVTPSAPYNSAEPQWLHWMIQLQAVQVVTQCVATVLLQMSPPYGWAAMLLSAQCGSRERIICPTLLCCASAQRKKGGGRGGGLLQAVAPMCCGGSNMVLCLACFSSTTLRCAFRATQAAGLEWGITGTVRWACTCTALTAAACHTCLNTMLP